MAEALWAGSAATGARNAHQINEYLRKRLAQEFLAHRLRYVPRQEAGKREPAWENKKMYSSLLRNSGAGV